jgi:iron complex transport system substrate-binding protein
MSNRSARIAAATSPAPAAGSSCSTRVVSEAKAADFERRIAALRERYAGRRPLRVFYQVWHQPLLTVNGHHVISEALEACGARNVFADLSQPTPTVSAEAVLAADPDVIVTGSVEPGGGDDHLGAWRRLRSLRTARTGALVVVDPDTLHRATDRMADGVDALCRALDAYR